MLNCGKQRAARPREESDFTSNRDWQKARTTYISNNTSQTFTNNNDIYLMEQVKKHRHRNGKLEFLIKWLGYSNCQKHIGARRPLALAQEYFQQSSLKKPIPTNKVFMTKILTKGAPITWRCHIPLTLVLVCILALWFSLTKSQPGTVPILNLESLYGCRQPQLLRMFEFSSLKNCSHSMLQQKATTKTFCWEVL